MPWAYVRTWREMCDEYICLVSGGSLKGSDKGERARSIYFPPPEIAEKLSLSSGKVFNVEMPCI
jgi:hypothetical protein